MIHIAVNGSEGRMGRLIVEVIEKNNKAAVALKLNRSSRLELLSPDKNNIDVLIDFSVPAATMKYLKVAKKYNIPVVIGTTGLNENQKVEITNISNHIPIILSPNMSIGVNITYKALELVANHATENMDIALIDIHHKHKKDSPSGTALRMKENIEKALLKTDRTTGSPISVASLRVGDTIGTHSALFALTGEEIEITHRALNRIVFAEGAYEAAKWLINQKPGLYDMQDVLNLR